MQCFTGASLLRLWAWRIAIPVFAAMFAPQAASAADAPAACPAQRMRVTRSAGGVNDYLGTVQGIADLCHLRRGDGEGDFYFGVWRSDWPGAGQAYPALLATARGPTGTRVDFITRSVPGLQWKDSFINEGVEPLVIAGQTYQVLKLAHERQGIEGNFYHSIITSWRDVGTGITLKTVENQIAGDSYGPATTWQALQVERLP